MGGYAAAGRAQAQKIKVQAAFECFLHLKSSLHTALGIGKWRRFDGDMEISPQYCECAGSNIWGWLMLLVGNISDE
jgi:hypothetical protein